MIKEIEIQNFRCFEEFKLDGFERVNLIGGKNNSGKTCLLEAIACLSSKFLFKDISSLRNQTINDLIYKNASSRSLRIISKNENDNVISNINLNFDENKNANHQPQHIVDNLKGNIPMNFVSQIKSLPLLNIAASFDNFDERLLKGEIISILKIVDERIEDIRTFSTKKGLYIKPIGEEYESLSSFGDATKNLIRYFTPVFEKELTVSKEKTFSVLLIDEIENGIHYTAHEGFWDNVFKLAKELNVQIFATTHSLEMIKTFNAMALKHGEGAYFEMARDIDTGVVFAEKHDAELLEYELANPKATFRGE